MSDEIIRYEGRATARPADLPVGKQMLDDGEIFEFLSNYSDGVQDLTWRLRDVVIEALPDAIERLYPGLKMIGYGRLKADGSWGGYPPIYITPFKTWVNLGFSWGVNLADPHGILSGHGLQVRRVQVKRVEDIDGRRLCPLLIGAWTM